MEREHKAEDTKEKVEQESNIPKKSCFKKTQNNNNVHLDNTYNRSAPNVSQIMKKNWSVLKINEKLDKTFEGNSIISFKLTRKPREIIDGNTIININVKRTTNGNMSTTQRQETHDVLQTGQDQYIFDTPQKLKDF